MYMSVYVCYMFTPIRSVLAARFVARQTMASCASPTRCHVCCCCSLYVLTSLSSYFSSYLSFSFSVQRFSKLDKRGKLPKWIQKYMASELLNLSTDEVTYCMLPLCSQCVTCELRNRLYPHASTFCARWRSLTPRRPASPCSPSKRSVACLCVSGCECLSLCVCIHS